jgi:hypothetical protein
MACGGMGAIQTGADRKVQTPEERRAARILALKDHSYRCGVLTATVAQALLTLRGALDQLRRRNRHGVNDPFIRELERRIKVIEELLDDFDKADREVNERLGIRPWREEERL